MYISYLAQGLKQQSTLATEQDSSMKALNQSNNCVCMSKMFGHLCLQLYHIPT